MTVNVIMIVLNVIKSSKRVSLLNVFNSYRIVDIGSFLLSQGIMELILIQSRSRDEPILLFSNLFFFLAILFS